MTFGFNTCGPNEALIVSGCCYRRPFMVPGGRVFVIPGLQQIDRISLNVMTVIIESPTIYTHFGVPITVTGVAQIKIQGSNKEMLMSACEQFLGKSTQEVIDIARETLEGHQRAIIGNMTVEEIYQDRIKFSRAVFDVASSDLVNMGISVVSFTLKDVKDDENYLKSLGMARTAQVKRDARIGEAMAQKDAGIKEALAEKTKIDAQMLNEIEINKSKRNFELQKAAFDKEVNAKKAIAELSYRLQASKIKQLIKEEEMTIELVERQKNIEVMELECNRKEKEMEAGVKKPAEAEKYRLEKIAEATKIQALKEANADAERIRLIAEAESFAILAKNKAESERMSLKAAAYEEYGKAAKLQLVMNALPQIAAEIATPLSKCKSVKMISNGDSSIGAKKITTEVIDIMSEMPTLVSKMTGIDMSNALSV